MTCNEEKVRTIIRTAATAASLAAGGMAPFPGADNTVLTPIQGAMVYAIGQCCGKTLKQDEVLAVLSAASVRLAGRVASQATIGRMPLIGDMFNVGTAAVTTQSIGWAAYEILCSEDEEDVPGVETTGEQTTVRANRIDIEDFKEFARTLEGKVLQTRERKNKFTIQVVEDGLMLQPKTAAPPRRISDGELDLFFDTFAERKNSLASKDYRDVGLYANYLLALLAKYFGKAGGTS
jgi:uncharacterized protein (DUF697 family)